MCTGGSAIRGSRVGAGPMGEQDRGFKAERITVSYYCSAGHEYSPQYAANVEAAEIPELIDCPNCGLPAGQDKANPPIVHKHEPYKTHIEVLVSEEMIGHRLGEFSPTTRFGRHGGKMQKEIEAQKKVAEIAAAKAASKPAAKTAVKAEAKESKKTPDKAAGKPVAKTAAKPVTKPSAKPAAKAAAKPAKKK